MKKILFLFCFLYCQLISRGQSISAGAYHSLWLPCNGSVPKMVGNNDWGQSGTGIPGNLNTLTSVNSLSGIVATSAGGLHNLFLKNDGTVWACGGNDYGQLGDGSKTTRLTPIQVLGLNGIISISAGNEHSLFLKNDGTVWACGGNYYGQLGDGTDNDKTIPVQVLGLNGIIAMSGGGLHSLFLKSDGTVWSCGLNIYGQLGDGTTTDKFTPVQVLGLSSITAISAGQFHSLFLKSNGTIWDCGSNISGQLGDGTTLNKIIATQVLSLTGITSLEAGLAHSIFLKSDGTVRSCGSNNSGQLGDGTTTDRNIPVQVVGLTGVTMLAAGGYHSLFLKNNGTVWACGGNSDGQLGDSTWIDRLIPINMYNTYIPEVNVKGNNVNIVNGDITPAAADHTNFGTVALGMSPSRTYTIQNLGAGNLVISSMTSSNAMFTIGALTPASPIPPGGSATFVLTFTPTSTGQKNTTITINNNDCDEGVYTYTVRGTGATTCPTLTFNETHVEACIGTTIGSITLSGAAGGTGPYTYSKDSGVTYQSSNVFSNLAPGIYPIRSKDLNGCVSAATMVNVNDLTPPTIICPPDTIISLDVYTNCNGSFLFPPPIVSDNCGAYYTMPATVAYKVNNSGTTTITPGTGANITSLPIDTNYITYFATDPSGNTDSCTQTVIIYDTVAPLFQPVFNNYAFETATGVTLEDLSTGATEIIPAGSDNVSSAVQTIPFYFDFHSVAYQNFSVSSNGLIGFGTTAVTTSAANSTTVAQHNKIYALWDNLHTGTNGSVKYKVVGARPNRKLVIEFNVRNASETGNYTKTFQAWLFETSHKVQLVYGAGTNMPAATIGVRGPNATVYNDVTSSNHTASKRIINDANTAWPGSGRSYIFTPAIFGTAAAGSCSANVSYSSPNFMDCNVTLTSSSSPQSGENFPVGSTPIIYTVSDATAPPNPIILNTATYSIPVIVEDTTLPVITCSGPQSFNTSPGLCTGAAIVTPPTVTDDCSSLIMNNALNFDGINDNVKVAPTSVINTASQSKRTVEVSFRVNDKSTSSQKQVIWEEGGTANGLNIYVFHDSLYFGIYSTANGWNGTWLSTPNIVSGQWHKACLVYDGTLVNGRLKAYLDGTIVGWADSSATLGSSLAVHNTGSNGIGALSNNGKFHDGAVTLTEGHYFGGDIDELRIWNVARSSSELLTTSLSPLAGNETGLALYYNFNQGTVCGNNTAVNFLDDITATNLNGVLTGMTLNGSCVSNWTTGAPAYSSTITLTNSFNNTSNASGNYPIGTTNVVWTATDISGNSVSCTQAITVNDNQVPTLVAPANQTLTVVANTCAANYTIADPISDNCTGATWGYTTTGATILSSSGNTRIDGSSSGVLSFNKGITTVTLTGTDGTNAATSVTFTVTVNDNQAPTLVAPANQTLNVVANTCAANYTIADPITDNCTGATWGYTTTGATILSSSGNTRADGSSSGVLSFNKGITTVTLTGTDGTNAATSVTFTVTVNDNQAPTLVAPANQTLNVVTNTCAANYTIADPINDNCTGATWGYSTTGATILSSSGNTRADGSSSGVLSFNKGITTVTLTGTDGTNAATSVTFTVTVNDNQAPTLVAPANQTLNVVANTCAANYTIADPINDNCTGATWGYSTTGATILSSSGNTRADGSSSGVLSFNKGITTVTLTGTDGTNAATSVTFTVTVNDNQLPILTSPGNQTIVANPCTASYVIPNPFTDNCPGGTWSYSLSGATIGSGAGIASGSNSSNLTLNTGVTTISLNGTDAVSNNAVAASFTVTVQAPEINVLGNSISILDGDLIPSTADHTDFGNVYIGDNLVRTYTIQNTGDAPLTIGSITSSNVKFTISGAPTSIAPGSSATFNVNFSPTAIGAQVANIIINNNDCNEFVYDFSIKGNGIALTLGTYANTTVISGQNVSITPTAAPINAVSMVAYTNSIFAGLLAVNPTTGIINITAAQPAGTYTVTVKAFGGAIAASTSFILTVTNPSCSALGFTSALSSDNGPRDIKLGDFNSDGIQDFITANYPDNKVSIRLGIGTGSYGTAFNLGLISAPSSVGIGDFNEDGKQDIAITSSNPATSYVSICLGTGTGSFGTATNFTVGNGPFDVAIADFNLDGHQDIVTCNKWGDNFSIRLGTGNGSFGPSTNFGSASQPERIAIGDFNSDGIPDMASAGNDGLKLFLGSGTGSFVSSAVPSIGYSMDLAVADVNEDGKQDLVLTNLLNTYHLTVLLGNGTGGFTVGTPIAIGGNSWGISVGDYNGDGHQDFVVANLNTSKLMTFLGNGTGTFSWSSNTNGGNNSASIAMGDLNADGKQDVLSANYIGPGTVSVILGGNVEINVQGGAPPVSILDGDSSPSLSDNTDVGNVTVGNSLAKTFTIQNAGPNPLSIQSITSSNAQFVVSGVPGSVAAGGSATFTLTFTPTAYGLQTAFITIKNNDCDEAVYDFAVQGSGACLTPPCNSTLSIQLFLQGYYLGASAMTPALFNQGVGASTAIADSILVSLYDPSSLTLMASTYAILNTNGTASCNFPLQYGKYYIVIKHRNSIETWSSNPVTMNASTVYNFTSSATMAYGDNQIEVEPNIWALFSGDINQDAAIDAFDYILLDPDIIVGNSGYLDTDLNGDGVVDAFDYILIDPNVINGIGVVTP